MGFKPLTLNTPPEEEAHVLAEDDAAIFQSIFGKDGVFETGDRMKATVINNNQVRVSNGVICVGGHIGRTEYVDYSDMIIENGEISKNRNDIIMAVFSTTGKTGIDEFKIEVKKGTPGIAAEDPEIVKGDLYEGSKIREFPLWRVKLEGINIVGVEKMFNAIPTIPELEEKIELLNGKIEKPTLYSSAEKQIGVTDSGEPIYRKTIYANMGSFKIPSSGYQQADIGTGVVIGKLFNISCHIIGFKNYALPYCGNGTAWGTWLNTVEKVGTQHVLRFYNNVNWGSGYTLVATIDYTK